MELRYAHLCDFAGPGDGGKPLIIGVFDGFHFAPEQATDEGFLLPPFYLAFGISGSVFERGPHDVTVRLMTGDGAEIGSATMKGLVLTTRIPGSAPRANCSHGFFGIKLPATSDLYSFEVQVAGQRIGDIGFHVAQLAQGFAS